MLIKAWGSRAVPVRASPYRQDAVQCSSISSPSLLVTFLSVNCDDKRIVPRQGGNEDAPIEDGDAFGVIFQLVLDSDNNIVGMMSSVDASGVGR